MRRKANVEVILHPPQLPYRETITRTAEAHESHNKQTGGHGQLADCKIRVEPLARGADLELFDDTFGGSTRATTTLRSRRRSRRSATRGYLAGYPRADFRVEGYDGQPHDIATSKLPTKEGAAAKAAAPSPL